MRCASPVIALRPLITTQRFSPCASVVTTKTKTIGTPFPSRPREHILHSREKSRLCFLSGASFCLSSQENTMNLPLKLPLALVLAISVNCGGERLNEDAAASDCPPEVDFATRNGEVCVTPGTRCLCSVCSDPCVECVMLVCQQVVGSEEYRWELNSQLACPCNGTPSRCVDPVTCQVIPRCV